MALQAWLLAARPKTLPAAVVPVWVGSMPVLLDGDATTGSWLLFWCTLVSCLCIQIATNLFNDAIDHTKGADTEKRLGPRRVTATGLLSSKSVMVGALAFCLVAAIVAIPMIQARGWPIVVIGLVSLFFAYGYTGGPYPLAYRGLGEIFVILFFGLVAVLGAYFVQSGEWGGWTIWNLAVQCGLYSSVLIAINNLRDVDEDRGTGKMTLAVRFGKRFARWEIVVFCWVPLLLGIGSIASEESSAFYHYLFACVVAIPAWLISKGVFETEPSRAYNRFLAIAAVQLLVFGVTFSVIISLR